MLGVSTINKPKQNSLHTGYDYGKGYWYTFSDTINRAKNIILSYFIT